MFKDIKTGRSVALIEMELAE